MPSTRKLLVTATFLAGQFLVIWLSLILSLSVLFVYDVYDDLSVMALNDDRIFIGAIRVLTYITYKILHPGPGYSLQKHSRSFFQFFFLNSVIEIKKNCLMSMSINIYITHYYLFSICFISDTSLQDLILNRRLDKIAK